MQLRAAKPELKVQDQVSATNGKKLGSATTAQIAIYGITATYVSMESSPALKEQKCYLKSKILFIPEIYLKLFFGTSLTLEIQKIKDILLCGRVLLLQHYHFKFTNNTWCALHPISISAETYILFSILQIKSIISIMSLFLINHCLFFPSYHFLSYSYIFQSILSFELST